MKTKKVLFILLIICVMMFSALLVAFYVLDGKYRGDFRGWTEEEAIKAFGKPSYDSREYDGKETDGTYMLGWYHGIGSRLGLIFRDGRVVDQTHTNR